MFNNWDKLERCRNVDYYGCKSNCLVSRSNSSSTFPLLSSFTFRRIGRNCYDFFNPSPKSFLKISKEPIQFFNEYSTHSKKIITIIMDGFGRNPNLFGSINGLTISRYQEPDEIVSFELGKRHLVSGYRKLWEKIKQKQVESDVTLDKIEILIDDFKRIIESKITIDFRLGNNPNLRNNTIKNTYDEKIFLEIFNEVNNMLEKEPRDLSIGPNPVRNLDGINNNEYWGLFFTYSKYYGDNLNPDFFMLGKKENVEELKETINELLVCDELNGKIKEFNKLKEKLDNLNQKEIYDEIKELYFAVNKDKMKLAGNCALCPPHSWIDAF